MTRFRFVLAFLISAILIVGSMWFRFGKTVYISAELTSPQESEGVTLDVDPAEFLPSPKTNSTSTQTATKPLTPTDMFSRQLFTDYISLKSQNQATPSNIGALASRYSESILNTNTTQHIDANKINNVSDSKESLMTYNQAISTLRNKYGNLISQTFGQSSFTNIEDQNFADLMIFVGKLYREATTELLTLPVPTSLTTTHIQLIENYLSSSEATKILSDNSNDPLRKYAALNTFAKNAQAESEILSKIQIIVLKGSTPNNSI